MNQVVRYCALVVVIIVGACSTSSSDYGEARNLTGWDFFSARVANSLVPPAPDQPHGYLLASIGMGKGESLHGGFGLWFRKKGEPWQRSTFVDNRTMLFYPPLAGLMVQPPRIEFLGGPKEVAVVAVPLTPGDYELFWFQSRRFTSKSEFSIPFTIAPQMTTYLGEYVFWETVKNPPTRNLLGMILHDNKFIEVTDSFQRDFESAEQAGRGLKGTRILRAVPNGTLPEGFTRGSGG